MRDRFGRRITYLRLSVTDRCDLRCTYCMPERMRFAANDKLLSIAELDDVASAFIDQGITKIRLTGGEPLVRRGVVDLAKGLSRHLETGALDELVMTTNGSLLEHHADALAAAGVSRLNVSLDHLEADAYSRMTRGGRLDRVMRGIDAAQAAGLALKINCVVLRDENFDNVADLAEWAHGKDMAISFIELMPMGATGIDRQGQYVSTAQVRARLEDRFALRDVDLSSGGPARYARTEAGGLIGFISPMSGNFCAGCNRVRVGADGRLHACLGNAVSADLKAVLRGPEGTDGLHRTIERLIGEKPERHHFDHAPMAVPSVARTMSATGG